MPAVWDQDRTSSAAHKGSIYKELAVIKIVDISHDIESVAFD
jgi:S-adenosylmethionine hydrolase